MVAQDVFARRQYADKHFVRPHRAAYLAAVGARHMRARHRPRGWGRAAAPGRRAAGPAHARGPRGAAVRRPAADGDQPHAHALAASQFAARSHPFGRPAAAARFGHETIGHFVADVRWCLRATRRQRRHGREFLYRVPAYRRSLACASAPEASVRPQGVRSTVRPQIDFQQWSACCCVPIHRHPPGTPHVPHPSPSG